MTDSPADPRKTLDDLEADRDYWRAQHDAVMQDWKADVDAWAQERAGLHQRPVHPGAAAAMLADLLRFFDPATGAITTRTGDVVLSDAFLRAYQLVRGG